MKNFEALGINKKYIQALDELGIKTPTEIQNKVIPLLLQEDCDMVGQAQTGTGKTAAYGLPLLEKMDSNINDIQALILCPTRELGQQVAKQLFRFTKHSDQIFTEAVYGGEKIEKQIAALTRPTHIVVATPGRLIDLVKRKAIDLRNVHTIILDEADEMLSMGFKAELDEILTFLHSCKNKWLFSATMPDGIQSIVKKHIRPDAHQVKTSGKTIVNNQIKHAYILCEEDDKLAILLSLIFEEHKNQGLIFCRTKKAAQVVAKQLISKNISADSLHGDLLQKERDKVMRAFKNGKTQILVSTDLAARGIDIDGLAYVAHYQLPESDEYYTHRSGRTARAGKEGLSLVLATAKDVKTIRDYERTLRISFKQIRESKKK
ncbi:MAG: DEAD/DEAH box helicase [Bacteroidetes bacterium]|nr:DEAD/DEAH box helicase [Bacteroidota bacterium]